MNVIRVSYDEFQTRAAARDPLLKYNPWFRSMVAWIPGGKSSSPRTFQSDGSDILECGDSAAREWLWDLWPTVLEHVPGPWIVVNGNTGLMGQLRFDGEDLKALQDQGLTVFMYEPIFLVEPVWRGPWYSKLSDSFTAVELEAIAEFEKAHDHSIEINVFLCDYGLGQVLNQDSRFRNVRFHCVDIYLLSRLPPYQRVIAEFSEEDFEEVDRLSAQFKKKSICLNFRYDSFREMTVGFLFGKGFAKESNITFYHSHDEETLLRCSDLAELPGGQLRHEAVIRLGIEALQSQLPLTLDVDRSMARVCDPRKEALPDINGFNIRDDSTLYSFYLDSFMSIVAETKFFTPFAGISEKTLTSIFTGLPFIVLGGPYTLEYIKDLGFKTFEPFFNESYDQIENHGARLEAIYDEIERLHSMGLDDLRKMRAEMKTITDYNYSHLIEGLQGSLLGKLEALGIARQKK